MLSNFVFAVISIESERELTEFCNKQKYFLHEFIPETLKTRVPQGAQK
jgi:hypothetical protein